MQNSTFYFLLSKIMESQADMNGKKDFFKCYELFYRTAKNLPTEMKIQYYDGLMEYGLYGTLPDDPVILSLLQGAIYSIDKTDGVREKQSQWWKNHKWNQYTKWDEKRKSNDKAQNNIVEVSGTIWDYTEDNGRKKENEKEWNRMKENETWKEIKENELFEKFWKVFPHARKWKKWDSLKYFLKQDPYQVLKQVAILNWRIESWIQDKKYIPACERWIRDFTPIWDTILKQDIKQIVKRHLKAEWDKHERFEKLKQDFPDVDFNELAKEVSRDRGLIKMNFN